MARDHAAYPPPLSHSSLPMPLPRAPPGLENTSFDESAAFRQAATAVAAERSRVEASRLAAQNRRHSHTAPAPRLPGFGSAYPHKDLVEKIIKIAVIETSKNYEFTIKLHQISFLF